MKNVPLIFGWSAGSSKVSLFRFTIVFDVIWFNVKYKFRASPVLCLPVTWRQNLPFVHSSTL